MPRTLDTDERQLQVLKLSQAVDDTAWATARTGALVTSDSTDNTIVVVTGPLFRGCPTPPLHRRVPTTPRPNRAPLSWSHQSQHRNGVISADNR